MSIGLDADPITFNSSDFTVGKKYITILGAASDMPVLTSDNAASVTLQIDNPKGRCETSKKIDCSEEFCKPKK